MPALSAKQGPGPIRDENPVMAIHLGSVWPWAHHFLWPCPITTQCP